MAEIAFSYNPKESFLTNECPAFKLVFLIVLSLLISTCDPDFILIYSIFLIVLGFSAGINVVMELMKMVFMLIIGVFILITEYLATENWYLSIMESVRYVNIIIIGILFITTTDTIELSASIAHYLEPVLKANAWKLANAVMLTFAMLPIIFSVAGTMLDSRRSRQGRFFSHPLKNATEYTISMMLMLFKKIEIFEDALYSRFYTDSTKRNAKKASKYDIISLVCLIILTTVILFIRKSN